jgi:effector-binding domain-containing protein
MGRKWGLLVGSVLLGGLIWYSFLKPYDYVVRFETKALPGTINQSLKSWGSRLGDARLFEQKELSDLEYHIRFNDSLHLYHWNFKVLNDSVTKVRAYVTDDDHSLANRWAIPFSETDFEKQTQKTVQDFAESLRDHLENFKVRVTGKNEIPVKYCACISLEGTQTEKAKGMIEYYSLLNNIMAGDGIALDGRPMVEVENWNMQNDSISYDFCFPVIRSDSLPQREGLFYKQIEQRPALRAVYNGNYITSDRAWYALLDYAEKNGIPVDRKPLEIFHTDPNMGDNELEWKAEVFMPIQD